MSSLPPPLSYSAPPLPGEVQQQLMAARLASKKVRRCASVATGDAWMIAIFAAISMVCGISSVDNVAVGLAMGAIAFVEFKGAGRVRRLDITAPRTLGYNQIAFAGVLIVYALWSLHQAANNRGMMAAINTPEMQQAGAEYIELIRSLLKMIYFVLIGVAVFAQGGTALYYFTREKYIREYLEQTPGWIVEMQKAGGTI